MYKLIAKLFFKLTGWKVRGGIPAGIKKCVLVAAPHTSSWDFIYGSFAWTLFGLKVNYLIKKEWFKFPMGIFFRSLGGLPVERSKHTNFVDAMVELVNSKKEIIVLITPEGTRKKVEKWKTGFYYLALKANIPIVLGKINYGTKTAFIGHSFMPSGNIEKDFEGIREFFRDVIPKNPENFSLEAIKP
ncbi:MAG: 1-acyl-sn-glycerol-3-phosphate acyltransferase [Bacteroidetes bacterium]|nr:1-acyl-sn-glycerol-3-phosphate acyltransferase [Bacteroidota bacterium]